MGGMISIEEAEKSIKEAREYSNQGKQKWKLFIDLFDELRKIWPSESSHKFEYGCKGGLEKLDLEKDTLTVKSILPCVEERNKGDRIGFHIPAAIHTIGRYMNSLIDSYVKLDLNNEKKLDRNWNKKISLKHFSKDNVVGNVILDDIIAECLITQYEFVRDIVSFSTECDMKEVDCLLEESLMIGKRKLDFEGIFSYTYKGSISKGNISLRNFIFVDQSPIDESFYQKIIKHCKKIYTDKNKIEAKKLYNQFENLLYSMKWSRKKEDQTLLEFKNGIDKIEDNKDIFSGFEFSDLVDKKTIFYKLKLSNIIAAFNQVEAVYLSVYEDQKKKMFSEKLPNFIKDKFLKNLKEIKKTKPLLLEEIRIQISILIMRELFKDTKRDELGNLDFKKTIDSVAEYASNTYFESTSNSQKKKKKCKNKSVSEEVSKSQLIAQSFDYLNQIIEFWEDLPASYNFNAQSNLENKDCTSKEEESESNEESEDKDSEESNKSDDSDDEKKKSEKSNLESNPGNKLLIKHSFSLMELANEVWEKKQKPNSRNIPQQ